MKGKRFREEQILSVLKEVEGGKALAEVCSKTPRCARSALDYHPRCHALFQRLRSKAWFFSVINGDRDSTVCLVHEAPNKN